MADIKLTGVESVEFDKHRWYVRILVTMAGGEVKEWVASADNMYTEGSGVWFGTREEYDAVEA